MAEVSTFRFHNNGTVQEGPYLALSNSLWNTLLAGEWKQLIFSGPLASIHTGEMNTERLRSNGGCQGSKKKLALLPSKSKSWSGSSGIVDDCWCAKIFF